MAMVRSLLSNGWTHLVDRMDHIKVKALAIVAMGDGANFLTAKYIADTIPVRANSNEGRHVRHSSAGGFQSRAVEVLKGRMGRIISSR